MTDVKQQNALLREHAAQHFEKFQTLLDNERSGPQWLTNSDVAKAVADSIHYGDARAFELLSYCVMPNHVHVIFSIVAMSRFPNSLR
jgi:hypothetical protein